MKKAADFFKSIFFLPFLLLFSCNLFIDWSNGDSVSGDKIVQIALAEQGKTYDLVGKQWDVPPYDLERYVRPDEAWCSEFVSWCYKAAGAPFTGAASGGVTGVVSGWILRTSTDIKNYFKAHKVFIDRAHPDWATFTPKAGDYIRYDTAGGGHSGIVNYVDVDGTTLHTVEGNVSDRVWARTITTWRGNASIDGFGIR